MEVRVARQKFTLSKKSFDKITLINDIFSNENNNQEAILLTAFAVLVKRYTDENNLCIGYANVVNEEKQNNSFYKGFTFHIDLSGNPSFADLLNQLLHKINNKEFEPTEFSLAEIKDEQDDTEAFPILFSMFEKYHECLDFTDLNNQDINPTTGLDLFKISLQLFHNKGIIGGWLQYRTDILDASLVEKMRFHFINLISEISNAPEKKIAAYKLLDEDELHQVLVKWNNTEAPYEDDLCLHQLIERQAAKTPDAVALVYKDHTMSYRELNNRANIIAYYLLKNGIKPEDKVVVMLELSFEAVIALLAVLKSGAAFVVLDPVLPLNRLTYFIKDSDPVWLITRSGLTDLVEFPPQKILTIDYGNWKNTKISENPQTPVTPENLAYIMYTSGSTGYPKGVLIQHNAIVNNMMVVVKRYNLTDKDKVISMSSLAFDASMSKLFPILTVGGAVVLPSEEEVSDLEKTVALIQTYKPVYYPSTPAILRVFNAMKADLSCMRMITTGGESLKFSDIDYIIKQIPVLNVYGPTEATVSSTSYLVAQNTEDTGERIPIGKPNPNCHIYILDKDLNCMPIGTFGTLYIGGKGVVRGYHNNPELTAEKFIPNPFVEGDRLYNTGDIARWLPDGTLDFLGRKDNQIKIRGYRIDIEEIEKTLNRFPPLKENKIIAKEAANGEKIMIAFIVPADLSNFQVLELKQFLKKYLPEVMLPAEYVILDKLPLNRSNKVDIQALIGSFNKRPQWKEAVSPIYKTAVEREIMQFWKEKLNRADIKPDDNFFHLGGHSLHAMQLKLFIHRQFNLDLSVKNIFEYQTIETLGAYVLDKMGSETVAAQKGELVLEQTEKETFTFPEKKPLAKESNTLFHSLKNNLKGKVLYRVLKRKEALSSLSYHEQRLWFLYRYQQEKAVYTILKAFNITGKVNTITLEKAFGALIMRHANLRKQFIEKDGEPKALVLDKVDFKLKHHPIQDLYSAEELSGILIEEEAENAFDLSHELPIRALLISKRENEHILVISAHHIIADGWSFEILLDELHLFYQAFSTETQLTLPPLSEQYKNYPQILKQSIQGERITSLLDYWKNKLVGKLERLRLPYDHIVTGNSSYLGGYEETIIPLPLTNALGNLSKEQDATLFMLFFSAFQSLLFRLTGQSDVYSCIPVADRQTSETKNLIGFFVNTLVLSTEFSDDPTFLQVLKRVKKEVLYGYHYQDLPFEMLANELRKETGIEANALIQVMFDFQNKGNEPSQLGNLPIENIRLKNKFSKFDLTISVTVADEGFIAYAEYKKELFEKETIHRMLNAYKQLIEAIAINPSVKISAIDLVAPEEKEKLLYIWNNTLSPIPSETVHTLFEEQVEKTPDAIAVSYNNAHYSYKTINDKANQLAHYLLEKKPEREKIVAVLMEESPDAIISLIAILKAGASYLPLTPSSPKERILSMLDEAKVTNIIVLNTHKDWLATLPYNYVLFDELRDEGEAKGNPRLKAQPNQIAYVMFTSGSTGKPKGVAIEHQGIVRLIKNTNYVTLDSNTKLLKTGAFSFDASTFEIWGILLNGGHLFLSARENLLDYQFLKEQIIENKITHAWFTSSWFNQLVDLDPEIFIPLQCLLIGGDKLSAYHVNKVKRLAPALEMINGYGPTENTTFSLCYKIENEQDESIPIGKPISNSTVYILDNSKNLVPIGIQGEIYVGGLGVGRGYINDEKLSRERFLDDPFFPGGKMYKTGDFGRWLNDGNLAFCGRNDHQIKLRGFRIEIQEIENALAAHPGIEEAVVLLKEVNDEKQLLAFYKGESEFSNQELHNFLRQSLPEVMIPAHIKKIDLFPFTGNGKIDKGALLKMHPDLPLGKRKRNLPPDALEAKLLALFSEVLENHSIDINDNFFHVGGHSLIATRLMAKVEKEFHKNLPLSLLFKAPTVKELARLIASNNRASSCLVPIQPKGNRTPIFLIPGYLFYYNLGKSLGNTQPLYGFEPIPNLLKTEEIAAQYIVEMRKIQPQGPYYIGGYCASGIIAYEMAQQLLAMGEQLGWLALFEVYTPEGTVSKASGKYLSDKMAYWKAGFFSSSLKGKYQLVYKESIKLFNYFFKNTFRKILSSYTIQPFGGNMILFKAKDGMVGSANDPYMGWSRYCSIDQIEAVEIAGNHSTIFKEPNVKIIADKLKYLMDKDMEVLL